ncbi:hypothetical protein [Nocardioides sp. B-3]|uniref:hypothetical protein n=1 Tax=Nocardioides sp. B-3 TaxID=2895565 RepID=UPI002153A632|nr:hypothetical protein [Nocardioides sp. B-3]UUZ57889.1 hypothetical protein LP418_16100 [Nocardioides sp. B-3]
MTHIDEPKLPGLNATDTRWLLNEAQRVLTELGHSSSVLDGVALALADGRELGLDNPARTLSLMPRRRWPRAVRDQLSTLLAMRPDQRPATADLRVKLWPTERADQLLTYDALEPLPGLFAVLAAQGKGASHEFGELDLVGDRDEAYETALTNLAALPLPRHTRRRVDPRVRGSWVEFLDSPDAHGAARVVVLPEVLRRVPGTDFPIHGVLVAVPTKFELWVHVPVDEDVIHTAVTMSWLAHKTRSEEPYPISPDVFLVSPDMKAVRLVRSHRKSCELDERVALELLTAPESGRAREAG